LRQIQEGDFVDPSRGIGEVGVDDDPVEVRNHKQRRVFKRFPVQQELRIGRLQILVFALVFPAEKPLLPNIGPSFRAALFTGSFFEGEPVPRRVRFSRFRMVEDLGGKNTNKS